MGMTGTTFSLIGASAGVGLFLTPVAIRAARSVGWVDRPHVRKVHKSPVPRVGGLAIMLATVVPLVALAVFRHAELGITEFQPALTLIVGALSVGMIGLLDDLFDVPSKYKLLALLAASAAFCAAGGAMRSVIINGHTLFELGLLAWPVTMLWIALVTVSINFIDGLDGLAGGIALIAAAVLAVGCGAGVAGHGQDVPSMLVAAALAGALIAFLVYNTHPARIFMGDCGSMFIGFLLAGTCVMSTKTIGTTRGLLLPALTLSVPLLDTLLTMVRRGVLQRSSLFAAERGHVHHRLLDTGLIHYHVVMLLQGVTLAAAALSLVCIFGGYVSMIGAAIVFVVALAGLFRLAGSVRARDTLTAVRRNRAMGRESKRYQAAFHELQLRFREVKDFDGWWKAVCHAAELLDFAKIDLPLTRRDGSDHTMRWRRVGETVADAASITAEVPIPQRREGASVRAGIEVLVNEFLESGGHRVALFSRLMGEFGLNQIKYHNTPQRPAAPAAAGAATPAVAFPGALPGLRVALVHDFLYTYAGAERVLEQMLAVFPQADLFSLFDFLPDASRGFLGGRTVRASFLQKLPLARKKHRAYLPLMPLAIEQLDVSGYDLILSSSYIAAKGVITRPDQLHVCYCHTPARFAWDLQHQYLGQVGLKNGARGLAAKMILHYIRNWDVRSANGVDVFLTNSDHVGRRIKKVYRRDAETVYPPVDTEYFTPAGPRDDFYLTASRMVPYKRIDLIVEAFTAMPQKRLVVIGDGPEMHRIKAKAGPNVTFHGHASAEALRRAMRSARAFVFAAEEDFGIAPVEAMACGTPVIAYGRGGAAETVAAGRTGVLFDEQTVASLTAAVERAEATAFDAAVIRRSAERFSAGRFRDQLADRVTAEWRAFERPPREDAAVAGDASAAGRPPAAAVASRDASVAGDGPEILP